jgi:hypothetical protein
MGLSYEKSRCNLTMEGKKGLPDEAEAGTMVFAGSWI